MPRAPRIKSESGYYHVIVRGNGRQLIFNDDEDRYMFITMARAAFSKYPITVIAWCLMGNHVHLLIRDESDNLSMAMQALLTRYARYFNKTSGHVGHVFQERFSASPIESDAYLLEAVRYIHLNPEKGGLGPADAYRWSSFDEYAMPGASEFTWADTTTVLAMLDGPEGFRSFCADRSRDPYVTYRPESARRIPDEQAATVAAAVMSQLGVASLAAVKGLPEVERQEALSALRWEGLSIRQIERLTGIGRNIIERARP